MAINNKPIDYLLCEGASDATFVCLYAEKKLGYSEDKTSHRTYCSTIVNAHFRLMEGPNRYLLVCSCGGCTNINAIFQNVVFPSIMAEGDDCRITAIIDRDNKTDQECYQLVNFSPINMQIGAWTSGVIQGNYVQSNGANNTISYKSFFAVVPDSSSGAFENVLIDSIYNSNPDIVNEVNAFYNSLSPNAKVNIQIPRKEIKARLETMIVLLDPEHFYSYFYGLFQAIDLNDSNIIANFSFIDDCPNSV